MKSLLFLWSNDTNCKKSRDSKKDTFHLEEIMSFVKDKIDLAWDLTVLSPARSYFSLAGMSIKYNFAFHVSDDMPKVVIICGGRVLSFIVHCYSLSGNLFSVDQHFCVCMRWKHQVVETLWAWAQFDPWFLAWSLLSSSIPLYLFYQMCYCLIAIQECLGHFVVC